MNALEEIQAAIENLTELRDTSQLISPAPWKVRGCCLTDATGVSVAEFTVEPELDMFVTLHRTIDAQLAILRHVATHFSGDLGISTNRHVVDLARAINGTPS